MRNSVFTMSDEEFHKLHMPSLIKLWKGQKERRMSGKDDISIMD